MWGLYGPDSFSKCVVKVSALLTVLKWVWEQASGLSLSIIGQNESGVAVHDDRIYVVGGYSIWTNEPLACIQVSRLDPRRLRCDGNSDILLTNLCCHAYSSLWKFEAVCTLDLQKNMELNFLQMVWPAPLVWVCVCENKRQTFKVLGALRQRSVI